MDQAQKAFRMRWWWEQERRGCPCLVKLPAVTVSTQATQPWADRLLKQQMQLCTLASLDQGTPHLGNGSSQFCRVTVS